MTGMQAADPNGWGSLTLPLTILVVLSAFTAWLASTSNVARSDDVDALKAQFRRPASLPIPRDNPLTVAKIELGRQLFNEKRLSADATIACSSCHDPALAFTDGVARGKGVPKSLLTRHTPSLWNLAWAPTLFWDGRANSLEEQARGPIEHPNEMAQPLGVGIAKLQADPAYGAAFAMAFPEQPAVSETNALKALAAYERTLVSPPTRFDAWIGGDPTALADDEIRGFRLFAGKAGCSSCHSGWNFTDHSFHDVGLPGDDLGRGPIAELPRANHAFKTPSLRELTWTAPYMHDGSLATLDDVIRFYEAGGVSRPTRSPDLPTSLQLTDTERNDLLAFLETLSSARPPRPVPIDGMASANAEAERDLPQAVSKVSQKDKQFAPASVIVEAKQTLLVVNDDTRPHNVRIFDPRLKFNSGVQEPGDTARIAFPQSGIYEAFCGIHPTMRLRVDVK